MHVNGFTLSFNIEVWRRQYYQDFYFLFESDYGRSQCLEIHFIRTNLICELAFIKIFRWITLKHGYPTEVPHWCTYWCASKEIQTRTNYCKSIKSQYSLLKWEEIAKMYQKTTNIGLYKERVLWNHCCLFISHSFGLSV